MDVDLFVSVRDGRFPVAEDNDFKSDNMGPDDIFIDSNNSFWKNNGYNKQNGIVFVVGVKAMTSDVKYTLVMVGPNKIDAQMTSMQTGLQYVRTLPGTLQPTQNVHYFRWFNWGFRDFRLNIEVQQG